MIAILLMVAAGGVLAAFVVTAMTIATRERDETQRWEALPPSAERDRLAASLLFHVVSAGGVSRDQAMRAVRRGAGIAAPVTHDIDVTDWAGNYARMATPQQRAGLLETAVQLAASHANPIPLRQYAALLDLNFGLGFHTDALAKLRSVYGFDYIDHAKDARPRHADRAGGGAPLFVRETRPREDLLRVLGITGSPTRQEITAAYRRLAAQHHPDKFHDAPGEVQSEAAARFIQLTTAYEELLLLYRD